MKSIHYPYEVNFFMKGKFLIVVNYHNLNGNSVLTPTRHETPLHSITNPKKTNSVL